MIASLLLSPPDRVQLGALSLTGLPMPERADDLAAVHTRLFGGLRPGFGLQPPYESVWRGERRMMGRSTQAVVEAYAKAGLWPETDGLPPDHVGVEVGFWARLMAERDETAGRGDTIGAARLDAQLRDFLADHLLVWIPAWCQAVAADDPGGFYGTLATMLGEQLEIAAGELALADAEDAEATS